MAGLAWRTTLAYARLLKRTMHHNRVARIANRISEEDFKLIAERKNVQHINAQRRPIDAYREAVGLAVATWALFEHMVDNAIWQLSSLDDRRGACLTSQIQSPRSKLLALEALAKLAGATESELRQMRNFRNQIEGLSRKRNRIVHDYYEDKDGKLIAIRSYVDKELVFGEEEVSIQWIYDFAEEVASRSKVFLEIARHATSLSSQDKPP